MSNVLSDDKKQSGAGAGAAGLVAAAHRGGHRGSSRDGERRTCKAAGIAGRGKGGRPGTGRQNRPPRGGVHRLWRQNRPPRGGVHRPWAAKTGHSGAGVHRPGAAQWPPALAAPQRERLRALPRADRRRRSRRGRNAMAIWQDLVDDHGFARATPASSASWPSCAGSYRARGARRHHHRAGRGSASRLRRGADGPRPEHRQVPAHAALRADARPLAASRCGC